MDNFESNSKYFRESFRGFNKDDVIKFVSSMIKEYSENEEKYKEEISESTANLIKRTEEANNAKKEIDNMKKEVETLKSDIQVKANDVAAIEKKYKVLLEEYDQQRALVDTLPADIQNNEELNKQIEELNKKINESEAEKIFLLDVIKKFELETGVRTADICSEESLKNKKVTFENNMIDMAEANKKIAALEEEISVVRKENEELHELRDKADELAAEEERIYEKITGELGNVIYSAKQTAENVVAKATAEAEDIMAKAIMKRTIFFEEYEKDVMKLKEKFRKMQEDYRVVVEKYKNSYDVFSSELIILEEIVSEIYDKI